MPAPNSVESDAACELVEPPRGFVDLRDVVPLAILAMRYHGTDNFTGARLPGYEAQGAWLESEAARGLARAAARLEQAGLRLIVYDAYRPRRATQAMVEWCRTHDRIDLLEQGFIAERSAHNRGRAIDVGLADMQGRALDMGSGWDEFSRRSHVFAVEGEALARRLQLRDALVREGFAPYALEWWHFNYEASPEPVARDEPYACR